MALFTNEADLDSRAAYHTCGFCVTHAQVVVNQTDENGDALLDENWQPLVKNDDEASAADMRRHYEDQHPERVDWK